MVLVGGFVLRTPVRQCGVRRLPRWILPPDHSGDGGLGAGLVLHALYAVREGRVADGSRRRHLSVACARCVLFWYGVCARK